MLMGDVQGIVRLIKYKRPISFAAYFFDVDKPR